MRARAYNRRVEIWDRQSVPDGFGGYTLQDVFVRKVWAALKTSGAGYKLQQFGINEFRNPVIISTRAKINTPITESNFIKLNGEVYEVKGVERVGMAEIELNIYCDVSNDQFT